MANPMSHLGGPLTGAQAGMRQPEIAAQLDETSRAITRLDQASTDLCQRLTSAQRPSHPTPDTPNKSVREVMCPIAEQIRDLSDHIDRITNVLNDNRERLEI